MAADDEISVALKAQTGELKAGMEEGARAVESSVDRISSKLDTLTNLEWVEALNAGIELVEKAAEALASTWESTVGKVVERGEELTALSRRLGESVEQLSATELAAKQAGVSLEALGLGYRKLAQEITAAQTEGSQANTLFTEGLGYTREELTRLVDLNPQEAILEVGGRLEQFADDATKTAAATTLFGRSYQPVLQFLREGKEEIEANTEASSRFGLTMTGEVAASAKHVGDDLHLVTAAFDGLINTIFGDKSTLDELGATFKRIAEREVEFKDSLTPGELATMREGVVELAHGVEDLASAFDKTVGAAARGTLAVMDFLRSKHLLAEADNDLVNAEAVLHERLAQYGGAGFAGGNTPDAPQASMASPSDLAAMLQSSAPPKAVIDPNTVKTTGAGAGGAGKSADAIANEEYQALLRKLQLELDAETQSAAKRYEIVAHYAELVRAQFGEESKQYEQIQHAENTAAKAAADERIKIATDELTQWKDHQLAQVEQEKEAIEFRHKNRLTDDDEYRQELRDLLAWRYGVLNDALDAEIALVRERDPLKAKQLEGQKAQLADQQQGDDQHLTTAQAQEQIDEITNMMDGIFGSLGQGFDRLIQGMIQGTNKFGLVWRQMGLSMFTQWISWIVQMLARWVAMQLAQLAIHTAVTLGLITMDQIYGAQKRATDAATARSSVYSSAASAAGKAADSVANIPYVGWILAPIAWAATFAVVAGGASYISAAGGAEEIGPGGAFAQLHPQEMVLPAHIANAVRDMATGSSGGFRAETGYAPDGDLIRGVQQGGGFGGDTLADQLRAASDDDLGAPGTATQIHIHAIDAKGVKQFAEQHARTLSTALANHARSIRQTPVR